MAAPAPSVKPAMKPPIGQTSNFIDPPSRSYVIIISSVFFLAVSTPFLILRIYTRKFINRRLWWDDYSAIIAWVGLFGLIGLLLKCLKYGLGVNYWNVTSQDGAYFTKLFGNIEIVARISIFFTKLSILLLTIRIFVPAQSKRTKIWFASWAVIWFNLLYCIALVLVVILQCVNKEEIPGKTCIDTYSLLVTASIINVLSDLMMLAIPLVAVWDLKMPMRRKIGISVVFAVGMLAVASSIARLVWQILHAKDPNRTIVLMKVALLAVAEHAVGIIVGCMPVFPALYRHISTKREARRAAVSKSGPHSDRSWRTAFGTSSYVHRRADHSNSKGSKKGGDPYLLSMDEIEPELENGPRNQSERDLESGMVGGGMTITTVRGGSDGSSLNEGQKRNTVEGFNGRSDTNALVSVAVQVESHPRDVKGTMRSSPPAAFVSKQVNFVG